MALQILIIVQIVLIALKLFGAIWWPWQLVFFPAWGFVVVAVVVLGIAWLSEH